jgi:hypothetical protein
VQLHLLERVCGGAGLAAAMLGEFKFGEARMLARFRPLGFAVAEQDQSVLQEAHTD